MENGLIGGYEVGSTSHFITSQTTVFDADNTALGSYEMDSNNIDVTGHSGVLTPASMLC